MARPEHIADIELENVEFASIEVEKITTDPGLLKGYTAFLEAVTKAGAHVDASGYRGVRFLRRPTLAEAERQLNDAQRTWDDGEKQYGIMASVGRCEHSWDENRAKEWAAQEGMPFPPEHTPIDSVDAVIGRIDEVTA